MKTAVLSLFIALGVFASEELAPFLRKKNIVIPNHFCGIVYTWSPGMPMSEKGLQEIKNFSKDNELHMRAVVDPQLKHMAQEFRNLIFMFTALISISASAASVFYNSQLVFKIEVDFVPTYCLP